MVRSVLWDALQAFFLARPLRMPDGPKPPRVDPADDTTSQQVRAAEARLDDARTRAFKEVLSANTSADGLHAELDRLRVKREETMRFNNVAAPASARDADEAALVEATALADAHRQLARRNLKLRASLRDAQERAAAAEQLAAERDELERSLANMANLVNAAQTRLQTVERRVSADGAPTRRPPPTRDSGTHRRDAVGVLGAQSAKKRISEEEQSKTVHGPTGDVHDTQARADTSGNQLRESHHASVYRSAATRVYSHICSRAMSSRRKGFGLLSAVRSVSK